MNVSPRVIFCILIGINIIGLTLINSNGSGLQAHTRMMSVDNPAGSDVPYNKFINPEMAYDLLTLLDVFSAHKEFNLTQDEYEKKYYRPYLGLRTSENYCEKHRAFFVYYPETAFQTRNIMSNFLALSVFRLSMIKNMGGQDVMPHIHSAMPKEYANQTMYDLRPDINIFFTTNSLYHYKQVGKHFSCLTQSSNHIPGHNNLYRKDDSGRALRVYGKTYENRPQCFNETKFFPKTWILTEEDQCREFFAIFNSEEYQQMKKERGLVYIRKIGAGAHQGAGVFPVNAVEEEWVRDKYQNGELCGKVQKNNLMQYAVWNPLLINGRKFDFRMFMLIASTNPLIVYYHDGFLRISLRDYDPESEERGAILTNIALSKPFFEKAQENGTYNGQTKDELMEQVFWMMPQLEQYLLKEGLVTDPNWLDNYLRPEFKKAYIHLIRMSQSTFAKKSSLFEIYGLDFMLDENLNLWFIEANTEPLLDGWSTESSRFFNQIIYDSFDIVHALLKSRVKRIVQYINRMIIESEKWGTKWDTLSEKELDMRRKEFEILTQNYFEPEYQVTTKNGFQLIIDENLQGVARYRGYLDKECM